MQHLAGSQAYPKEEFKIVFRRLITKSRGAASRYVALLPKAAADLLGIKSGYVFPVINGLTIMSKKGCDEFFDSQENNPYIRLIFAETQYIEIKNRKLILNKWLFQYMNTKGGFARLCFGEDGCFIAAEGKQI